MINSTASHEHQRQTDTAPDFYFEGGVEIHCNYCTWWRVESQDCRYERLRCTLSKYSRCNKAWTRQNSLQSAVCIHHGREIKSYNCKRLWLNQTASVRVWTWQPLLIIYTDIKSWWAQISLCLGGGACGLCGHVTFPRTDQVETGDVIDTEQKEIL